MTELSIIIPAKNEASFIGNCIDHILRSIQYWGGDAEIILVDNGSTDSTKKIALDKGAKIIEAPYVSIAQLRNTGARMAKGDIVAFIDSDCLLPVEWVTYCLEDIKKDNVAGVGARALPDKCNTTWVERTVASFMAGSKKPERIKWLGTSNLMINKHLFWSVNGFDENLKTGEDVQFCKKLNKYYKFYLEMRIDVIHLRESKTLIDLFKREFWRGSSNLSVLKASKYDYSEFPSIIIPLVSFLGFMSVILWLSLGYQSKFIAILILFHFFIPVALIFKKKVKINSINFLLRIYIISYIYILARSFSLVFEAFSILYRKSFKKEW